MVGIVASGIILIINEPMVSMYNITSETREIALQLMDAVALILIFPVQPIPF